MKVCVIVDDFIITGMISKLLKANGHECVVENDGRAGLSALKKEVFDVVILEVAMPDLSGLDIVKALNKSGRIKDHKICVFTASSISDVDIKELKTKGIVHVLKKPVDLPALIPTLEKLVNSDQP